MYGWESILSSSPPTSTLSSIGLRGCLNSELTVATTKSHEPRLLLHPSLRLVRLDLAFEPYCSAYIPALHLLHGG